MNISDEAYAKHKVLVLTVLVAANKYAPNGGTVREAIDALKEAYELDDDLEAQETAESLNQIRQAEFDALRERLRLAETELRVATRVCEALVSYNSRDSWQEIPGSDAEMRKRRVLNTSIAAWQAARGDK